VSFRLTGGCNCGAVRYEVTSPLVWASYCHCQRCQRRTGAGASANGRAEPGSFRITRGEDRLRAWKPGTGAHKYFCGDCGSALFSRGAADPDQVGVRLGSLDSDPEVRPSFRQYVDFAAVWEAIPKDGLPRYPGARPPL
jgi:hypothetical protein